MRLSSTIDAVTGECDALHGYISSDDAAPLRPETPANGSPGGLSSWEAAELCTSDSPCQREMCSLPQSLGHRAETLGRSEAYFSFDRRLGLLQ